MSLLAVHALTFQNRYTSPYYNHVFTR